MELLDWVQSWYSSPTVSPPTTCFIRYMMNLNHQRHFVFLESVRLLNVATSHTELISSTTLMTAIIGTTLGDTL